MFARKKKKVLYLRRDLMGDCFVVFVLFVLIK